MKEVPKKIYIQQSEDPYKEGFQEGEHVTWCTEPIEPFDVEYVVDTEFERVNAEIKKLETENERLKQNWQELEEFISAFHGEYNSDRTQFSNEVLNKMQEIEEAQK